MMTRVFTNINRFSARLRAVFLSLAVIVLLMNTPLSAWAKETSHIDLTPEEQAWLNEHPDIALGAPISYPPMVIERNDGTHVGVLVDFFDEVSEMLGQRIRLHIEEPWTKVQEQAEKREISGLALGASSPPPCR